VKDPSFKLSFPLHQSFFPFTFIAIGILTYASHTVSILQGNLKWVTSEEWISVIGKGLYKILTYLFNLPLEMVTVVTVF
jgi:hypothetical protein